jgi:hypothetical protein
VKSSVFAKWALGHRFEAHVVLHAVMSLVLIGMYFSGHTYLQQLVAPTMKTMPLFSSREFGALEMLQNFLLLSICFYSVRCFMAATTLSVRLFSVLLIVLAAFTFVEEIDYGAHFIEYFSGQTGSLEAENWDRNWHNKVGPGGIQNVSYMKMAMNFAVLAGFVLGPLLLSQSRFPVIRLLVPSKWMISTVILIVLLSQFAHYLDDNGFSEIAGVPGNLEKNISEFRELNMYYLLLLYTALLHERIITLRNSPRQRL